MDDTPDVLKRLEGIEVHVTSPSDYGTRARGMLRADALWLLRLTRALLDSQWELMERVGNQECNCLIIAGLCRRCKALDHAERVRKGEV